MNTTGETVLRFKLDVKDSAMSVFDRFHPRGQTVLNRTEWRGKPPRSCAVTKVSGHHVADSNDSPVFDVEVTFRPKGCITYVANTRYEGWTATLLDQTKEGVLLNGHGQPLVEGQPPVYLPYELYEDLEFNDLDFGEFVGEFPVGLKRTTFARVLRDLEASERVRSGMKSGFIAPRRQRSMVKIVLSNAPSGTATDGFGTRLVNVNLMTPHLKQVLFDHLLEVVSGSIEGRYSLKEMSNDEFAFVELDDLLVDVSPNEEGKDSRFGILDEYMPKEYLDQIANRIMSIYAVDVTVVEGEHSGLLLRRLEVD